jgi:hypothetical protein
MSDSHDAELEQLLRRKGRASFGPGFGDRVMRRVGDEAAGPFAAIMPAQFLRLAAGALAVAAALVTFSLAGASNDSQTVLEAVLGLQPLTADAVYDAQALFFAEEVAS